MEKRDGIGWRERAAEQVKRDEDDRRRAEETLAGDFTIGMLRKGWILPQHVQDFKKDLLTVIRGG